MIKAVFKDEVRNICYGQISHDAVSIIQCTANNVNYDGTMVTLAAFTKDGLKVIQSRIGKVIKATNDCIRIQFNTSFGFDDKLYALVNNQARLKTPAALVLAYKEL